MHIRWLGLAVSLASSVTLASGEESCPTVSSLVVIDGFFEAPSAQSYNGWRGSAADRFVVLKTFIGAVFKPSKGTDRTEGYLEGCTYATTDNTFLTLQYRPDLKRAQKVRLPDTYDWQLAKGSLGMDTYECKEPGLKGCEFTVLESYLGGVAQ